MNAIVVYSSQTGRTKQIAQAVVSGLPEGTPCVSVDEMPKDLSGYDCVFVGFWSDKDQADPKGQEALRQIKNDNVAVFATLHDDPYSDQASKHLRGAVELLKPGSGVIGTYVTWTDKDKYMQVPVDESELNLDQARAFAQDTMSRVQKLWGRRQRA